MMPCRGFTTVPSPVDDGAVEDAVLLEEVLDVVEGTALLLDEVPGWVEDAVLEERLGSVRGFVTEDEPLVCLDVE